MRVGWAPGCIPPTMKDGPMAPSLVHFSSHARMRAATTMSIVFLGRSDSKSGPVGTISDLIAPVSLSLRSSLHFARQAIEPLKEVVQISFPGSDSNSPEWPSLQQLSATRSEIRRRTKRRERIYITPRLRLCSLWNLSKILPSVCTMGMCL